MECGSSSSAAVKDVQLHLEMSFTLVVYYMIIAYSAFTRLIGYIFVSFPRLVSDRREWNIID